MAKELAELGDEYTAEDCGQEKEGGGTQKHLKKRQDMVQRLKLRAPELPPPAEKKCLAIRNIYCNLVATHQGKMTRCDIVK